MASAVRTWRASRDMVLRDDAFSSIVAAVHQGRIIFDNIRKFVVYCSPATSERFWALAWRRRSGFRCPFYPSRSCI
jgi:Cation transport ATPase